MTARSMTSKPGPLTTSPGAASAADVGEHCSTCRKYHGRCNILSQTYIAPFSPDMMRWYLGTIFPVSAGVRTHEPARGGNRQDPLRLMPGLQGEIVE